MTALPEVFYALCGRSKERYPVQPGCAVEGSKWGGVNNPSKISQKQVNGDTYPKAAVEQELFKKVSFLIPPTPARQDAPCPRQGRSEEAKAYRGPVALRGCNG